MSHGNIISLCSPTFAPRKSKPIWLSCQQHYRIKKYLAKETANKENRVNETSFQKPTVLLQTKTGTRSLTLKIEKYELPIQLHHGIPPQEILRYNETKE